MKPASRPKREEDSLSNPGPIELNDSPRCRRPRFQHFAQHSSLFKVQWHLYTPSCNMGNL